jgi:hypothetical protein
MQGYRVETYTAGVDLRQRASWERLARWAAEDLATRGTDVRFIRPFHRPEDEISLFVFDAPSRRDAALAAEQANLQPLRPPRWSPLRRRVGIA